MGRRAGLLTGLMALMTLMPASLLLSACGGGGGDAGSGKSAPTYAVGGTLAGLTSGTLVLSSGADSVSIAATDGIAQDRPFQIAALPTGAAYDVKVAQQPAGVSCTVVNGTDVVGTAAVTAIQVLCVNIKSLALVAGVLPTYGAQDGLGSQAGFYSGPGAMQSDAAGNLYVTDSNAVRKITPSGIVTTLAGKTLLPGYVDATGPEARFGDLLRIAVDPAGTVYVSDRDNRAVRRVSPAGVVSTLAREERFTLGPIGVDGSGTVHLLTPRGVLKMAPTGQTSLLVGDLDFLDFTTPTAFLGGAPAWAMVVDRAGSVYLSGAQSIDKVSPGGQVSPFFVGRPRGRVFGCIPAPYEPLEIVNDLALGPDGSLWVTQSIDVCLDTTFMYPAGVHRLLKIDAAGTLTPFDLALTGTMGSLTLNPAGEVFFSYNNGVLRWTEATGAQAFVGRGLPGTFVDGPATTARFNLIRGLTVLADGGVIASDVGVNRALRKIAATGDVTTVFQAEDIGAGASYPFTLPTAVDAGGAVHVVYGCGLTRIEPAGTVTRIFDVNDCAGGAVDGPAGVARLGPVSGVSADSSGSLVVWHDTCLRRVARSGALSNLAGDCAAGGHVDAVGANARFTFITLVAPLANGEFLLMDSQRLKRVSADGTVLTLQTLSQFPLGLAGDGRGNVAVILNDGVHLFFGTAFDRRTKIIDYGPRTVLGPLPTSVEGTPGAIGMGQGKLFISVKDSVFAVDL